MGEDGRNSNPFRRLQRKGLVPIATKKLRNGGRNGGRTALSWCNQSVGGGPNRSGAATAEGSDWSIPVQSAAGSDPLARTRWGRTRWGRTDPFWCSCPRGLTRSIAFDRNGKLTIGGAFLAGNDAAEGSDRSIPVQSAAGSAPLDRGRIGVEPHFPGAIDPPGRGIGPFWCGRTRGLTRSIAFDRNAGVYGRRIIPARQ